MHSPAVFLVCGVKNDVMAFILPNFKLAFWVMFLFGISIAFFHQKGLQDI